MTLPERRPTRPAPALVKLGQHDLAARLIDSVRDYAIFMLSPEGVIATWNSGAERLKGYTAQDAIGCHFSMFYPDDAVGAGWPQEELRRARANGRMEDEGWRVRKDGSKFWANVVISPIWARDGELLGYSKVTRDLTERRRQEQRLRESEESLRLVVEGVRDHAMFLLAADGSVASWNVGAQRVLGWAADVVVGRPLEVLYPDEDRIAGKPRAELASAQHAGFLETEGWRERADGTRFWAHCETTALRDPGEMPRGYVQVIRDLSERMRVRELEDEGQRIHEFIAMLSHELRNPLAPIGNAVGLLRRAGGPPEVGRFADMIGRQADHLSRLVEDLLDVTRVTSGRIQVRAERLELNTLVKLTADAMRPELDARSHELRLRVGPDAVFVDGDATRLNQVVTNLLGNASRYTPPGGLVQLSIEKSSESDGRGIATIVVSDNGVGMSEPLIQRAFDPFVQGSRELDRSNGGLGIGLTLVKRIVELHGGRVVAASAGEGKGTRITVTLPLAAATAATTPPAPAPARLAVPGRRVLIVDDNRDAAESLGELLRLAGHPVRIAADGEQALEMARASRPDTVLLDLGLPGMDGFEVARRLHLLPGLEGTRLIAITGYGQASDREATARAGFAAHLVKPVDFDALERLLA